MPKTFPTIGRGSSGGVGGVLWGMASAVACSPTMEPVELERFVLNAPRSFDASAAERQSLRDQLDERLRQDRTLRYDPSRRKSTHLLRINIGEVREYAIDGERQSLRLVDVELAPRDQAPRFQAVGRSTNTTDQVPSVLEAFDEAWQLIATFRRLERQRDDALIAALEDDKRAVQEFAVRRLGDREARAAVGPLCALLEKEDHPQLALAAIGALVAIGDESAVAPLIEMTQHKHPRFVLQIVFAVGSIGGRTAEAYLVTLASGHPSPEVQQGAKDALAEMDGRTGRGSPGG